MAYADKPGTQPLCACGKPAIGAKFTEFDSGYPMGQTTGTAKFDCGCEGPQIYSLKDVSGWDLFMKMGPGVYRVRKKTQQQRIKEASIDATSW